MDNLKTHTKESLIADLKSSGINPRGTLLVHSSAKSVGECENRADTILDAFIEYMKDGLLIFPTHTWEYISWWKKFDENGFPIGKNNIYVPAEMPSCVGLLTNLFMKREGVLRSLHPTHSVAALGKDAAEFISGEELARTPCPRSGCYGKLYDRGAQILFMGCKLSRNTYLHGVEEWNNIPDRLTEKPQELYIKLDGELIPCPQLRHHFSGGDVSENYIKAESVFIEKGAAAYCKIGSAHSVLCDAVKMADIITEYLKVKPDLFSNESPMEEIKL
jgi:aminoglycoside 3-N-acetyltransferase